MSTSAQNRGLKGTIIDGGARDPLEIKALGYPVFSRTINPRKAVKDKYGALDIPVRCGSLTVNSGDIILADVNGIVAFPAADLSEAVRMATEVREDEIDLTKQILSGRTIFEIRSLNRLVPQAKSAQPTS
jgi:4-hydroxy-4-methyl-2-oxoglutarate aldolase